MYSIQLFTRKYVRFAVDIEVDSDIIPKPGDMIEREKEPQSYVVFDVTHYLSNGKSVVVVSAVESARCKRHMRLSENGYLDEDEAESFPYDNQHLHPGDDELLRRAGGEYKERSLW